MSRYAAWAETQDKTRDGHRYDAACYFARCAALAALEKEALIDKAIAQLRKAKGDGYFVADKVARLKKDADFDGLRMHPKFAGFVAELKPPPPVKSRME